MADLVALKTAFETNPRYTGSVTGGTERDLLTLLGAPETGQTIFLVISSDDLLNAIGDGIRALTADERGILSLYTSREEIDFTRANIRTEILNLFTGTTLNNVQRVISRTRTFGEGFEGVTIRDIITVLDTIPTSVRAVRKAGLNAKKAANEATISTLRSAFLLANPSPDPGESAEHHLARARSQAIKDMYSQGLEALG